MISNNSIEVTQDFVRNPLADHGHHASGNLWAANGTLFTHDCQVVVDFVDGVFEIVPGEYEQFMIDTLEGVNEDYFILNT